MTKAYGPINDKGRAEELSGESRIDNHSLAGSGGMLSIEFRGSAREYFRIWIVNKCLTLITLGVFSAWAKVRKKRYLYSHTSLGGTPFQYLGRPIPILKGRLIAAAAFLLYYVSSHFFTSLLPYVLAAGLVAAPWAIVRSAAFNARYSAFRNMTFHFDGSYPAALRVLYAWGLIPVFVIATMLNLPLRPTITTTRIAVSVTAALIFAATFPWWIRRLKKFIVEHTSYGGKNGTFSATGGQFFKIYLLAGTIIFGVMVASGILAAVIFGHKKQFLPFAVIVPFYASSVLVSAFIQARSGNLVWNHTVLGPVRFESALRCRDLLRIYVTNALGIIGSLGLLVPWAVIRTMKYRADTMRVLLEGELTEFEGSDPRGVTAVGAETLDLFDFDFSL